MDTASFDNTISRYWRMVGGVLMNMALGSLYAWSYFKIQFEAKPEKGGLGLIPADVGWAFSLAIAVFAVSFIVGGRVQDKFGPFPVSLCGSVLLAVGFVLCGTAQSLADVLLYFGVLAGIGIGLGYATPIPVMAKWFPDKRGLAVGMAVAGFGAGSAVFGMLFDKFLVPSYGWRSSFYILGGVFFLLTIVSAFLLKNPPAGYRPAGWSPAPTSKAAATTYMFTPGEMTKTPAFYLMWVAYTLGCSAGLMVISQLKPFVVSITKDPDLQKLAVLLILYVSATGNVLGRILSGWMSDRFGRLNTLRLMIGLSVVGMPLLFLTGSNIVMLFFWIFVVYWSFGTQLSVNASTAADFWGTKNAGVNYGLLFTAYGVAGIIGPKIADFLKVPVLDAAGLPVLDPKTNAALQAVDYKAAFFLAGGLAVVALLCELMVKRPSPPAKSAG